MGYILRFSCQLRKATFHRNSCSLPISPHSIKAPLVPPSIFIQNNHSPLLSRSSKFLHSISEEPRKIWWSSFSPPLFLGWSSSSAAHQFLVSLWHRLKHLQVLPQLLVSLHHQLKHLQFLHLLQVPLTSLQFSQRPVSLLPSLGY